MSLEQDKAKSVLEAEVVNAINAVGGGGTMKDALREEIDMFAITPELAKRRRAYKLIEKYIAGATLTAEQWAEVHMEYPEFREGSAVPPEPIIAPGVQIAPAIGENIAGTGPFVLDAVPEVAPKQMSKELIEKYEALYGTSRRQIFRWRKEGAPLHDPAAMPGWWDRTHTWTCPAALLEAAKNAPPPRALVISKTAPDDSESVPTENDAPQKGTGPSIDLADYALREDEDVQQAETLVAVAWNALQSAYKNGETSVEQLHKRHERAMETLRKVRTAARSELIARRRYITREEVDSDRAMAAELLRQMRTSMVRQVLELCPDLDEKQRDQVKQAIVRVRGHEDRVLCDPTYLRDVRNEDDLARILAAA